MSSDIVLLFPPSFAVDQPYLALPALTAFLRTHGMVNARQWDSNLDSFWYFIDKERLRAAAKRAGKMRYALESHIDNLSPLEITQYESMVAVDLTVDPVLEEIDAATDYFLHCMRHTSLAEYQYYLRVITKALKIASAPYYPSEMSLRDFTMRYSPQSSTAIFEAINSGENPYREYFEERVLPRLQVANPMLIGMSLACMSQIIPSFTLASLIRASLPESKIVFGGQVFNRLVDRVKETPALFQLVDFFVVHEGETALLSLCRSLQGEIPLDDVPNLIYFDAEKGKGIQTQHSHVEDVANLPLPDFSDLDLSRYLSPRLVLPYQPIRGCYWHRCAFCNHHVIHPASARHRSPEDLVRDLGQLKTTYGTDIFTLVSESVEPSLMNKYATSIADAALSVRWYAGARMEASLNTECLATLRRGGCEKLYLGMETGSQKVLNDMQKGIRLSDAERILRDCARLDIAVHLFLMIGYPTETREDLEASTLEILRLAGLASRDGFTYYISTFQLKPQTPVFLTPSAFGVSTIHRREMTKDLEYLYDFDALANPGGCDYTLEAKAIERALDEIHGPYDYPENIVHFMAMRGHISRDCASETGEFNRYTPTQGELHLRRRPALGFAMSMRNITEATVAIQKHRTFLIYDLTTDSTYEIKNSSVWEALRSFREPFTVGELRAFLTANEVCNEAGVYADVNRLVRDLLYSGLVVEAEEGE